MFATIRQVMARLRNPQRGVSAMEFVFVLVPLTMMLMGLVDYGWFFSREALITSALEGAVRTGGNLSPDMGENFGCVKCVNAARDYAVTAITEMGVTVDASDINPVIIPMAGTCAVQLCPTIPHEALLGMVPVPANYGAICTVALAQTVDNC